MNRTNRATVAIIFLCVTACMQDPDIPASRRSMADFTRELYVINGLAESISIIDPATYDMYPDVFLTGTWPNHIHYHANNLYLVNSGDNSICIYDEDTFDVRGEIYLGANSNPWRIIPVEGTAVAYVPNFVSGDVSIIDLDEMIELKRIPVGKGPEGGAYCDGKVYVCNSNWDYQSYDYGEGTVSVIDVETRAVVATIGVATNPQSAIAFPDRHEVHIVCTGRNGTDQSDDGRVIVVDTISDETVATIEIGGSPVSTDGCLDTSREIAYLGGCGALLSYGYVSRTVIHGSANPIVPESASSGDFLSGIVVDELNGLIYVCDFSCDAVIVLDLVDHAEIRSIEGSDGVQAIFLFSE